MTKIRAFYELCKPRVVVLLVFTAVIGMLLAPLPESGALLRIIIASLGIAAAAASAAAFNQILDQQADAKMARTQGRPLPTGTTSSAEAIVFASFLGLLSIIVLTRYINTLTAVLTFFGLVAYAVIYTVFLKRATSQNIVIGGFSGAIPPLLGWTSMTGSVHPYAWLLVAIVFVWTPPHFWALALARKEDYAKADIPMLPVTHGEHFTRLHILFYTVLLVIVTTLPFLLQYNGYIYLFVSLGLGIYFIYLAWKLVRRPKTIYPMSIFSYSITYLFALFSALLVDHYWLLYRS